MTTAMCAGDTVTAGPKSTKKVSKIERYGWILRDLPGVFMEIDKNELNIDYSYQREDINHYKILEIARAWSWVGCGAILVAARPDGTWFVFDGQHRVLAARKRADVSAMPCMVYECESIQQEAAAFLISNDGRKPVTALGKFKCLVKAEDETAMFVGEAISSHNLEITKTATRPGQIKCVKRCQVMCALDRDAFEKSLSVAVDLCSHECAINDDLLNGIFACHRKYGLLNDKRFVRRLLDVGASSLLDSIRKTKGFRGTGGDQTVREGVLIAVNKGLRHKFGEESQS